MRNFISSVVSCLVVIFLSIPHSLATGYIKIGDLSTADSKSEDDREKDGQRVIFIDFEKHIHLDEGQTLDIFYNQPECDVVRENSLIWNNNPTALALSAVEGAQKVYFIGIYGISNQDNIDYITNFLNTIKEVIGYQHVSISASSKGWKKHVKDSFLRY